MDIAAPLARPLARRGPIDRTVERKSQWIRGLDVVVVGPLMVAGGLALWRRNHKFWGATLGAIGLLTIVINAFNLVKSARALDGAGPGLKPTIYAPDLLATEPDGVPED